MPVSRLTWRDTYASVSSSVWCCSVFESVKFARILSRIPVQFEMNCHLLQGFLLILDIDLWSHFAHLDKDNFPVILLETQKSSSIEIPMHKWIGDNANSMYSQQSSMHENKKRKNRCIFGALKWCNGAKNADEMKMSENKKWNTKTQSGKFYANTHCRRVCRCLHAASNRHSKEWCAILSFSQKHRIN